MATTPSDPPCSDRLYELIRACFSLSNPYPLVERAVDALSDLKLDRTTQQDLATIAMETLRSRISLEKLTLDAVDQFVEPFVRAGLVSKPENVFAPESLAELAPPEMIKQVIAKAVGNPILFVEHVEAEIVRGFFTSHTIQIPGKLEWIGNKTALDDTLRVLAERKDIPAQHLTKTTRAVFEVARRLAGYHLVRQHGILVPLDLQGIPPAPVSERRPLGRLPKTGDAMVVDGETVGIVMAVAPGAPGGDATAETRVTPEGCVSTVVRRVPGS